MIVLEFLGGLLALYFMLVGVVHSYLNLRDWITERRDDRREAANAAMD